MAERPHTAFLWTEIPLQTGPLDLEMTFKDVLVDFLKQKTFYRFYMDLLRTEQLLEAFYGQLLETF